MKILTIVGARPQLVKAGMVSRAIQRHNTKTSSQGITEIIIHTGQHYDRNMSDVFFKQLDIPQPHANLQVGSGSHAVMTANMMIKIEASLLKYKPNAVLIYGDTNSTLAGALVAAKLNIPIVHVESGLRSYNQEMPEEINRITADHLSQFLFCPTETAIKNLHAEGLHLRKNVIIENVGDVMYDIAMLFKQQAIPSQQINSLIETCNRNFYLLTLHRPSNVDNEFALNNILNTLSNIARTEETAIIFPVHPRTKKQLHTIKLPKNFHCIDPVGYLDMISLLNTCKMVMTDSGGLQKEACFFEKPCVILRNESEWLELIENGYALLAGNNPEKINETIQYLEKNPINFTKKLYGNGNAAEKIVEKLAKTYNL